ncbi:hypothetical protein BJ742DRAFT_873611 [Cladochytrium replicatum]|nr:hypothetical protein BJ742DRAFT_873611 [Cladochytrium replicatum]
MVYAKWFRFKVQHSCNRRRSANYIDKARASANGHMEVLEWWIKSGSVKDTSRIGRDGALDWWKSNNLHIGQGYPKVLDIASANGHVNVLEWWKISGLELNWSVYTLRQALVVKLMVCLLWTDPPTDPSTTSLDFTKTSYELCGFGICASAATGIAVPALFARMVSFFLERVVESGRKRPVRGGMNLRLREPPRKVRRRGSRGLGKMAAISLLSAITMFAVSLDISAGINKMCDAMVTVSRGPDNISCDSALQLITGKSLLTLKVTAVGAWALMGSWWTSLTPDERRLRNSTIRKPDHSCPGAEGVPATPPAASISMKEVKRTTKTPSFVSRQGTNVDLDMEDPFAIDDDGPWNQKPTSSANLMPPSWGPAGYTSKSQPQKWRSDAGNMEEETTKPGGGWVDSCKTPTQARDGGNWGDNYKKSKKSKESMNDPFADRNQINPFDDME